MISSLAQFLTMNKSIPLSLIYFSLVFGAGCILGPFRILLLEPRVGTRNAELLELLVMVRIIWQCAQFIADKYAPHNQTQQKAFSNSQLRELAAMGLMALLWLLAVEVGGAAYFRGGWRGVRNYFWERDVVSGSAYMAVLLFYAVMPWHVLEARDSRVKEEGLWNEAMWSKVPGALW
jgi:hypothetical protein